MDKFHYVVEKTSRVMAWCAMILVLLMVIGVVIDVVLRAAAESVPGIFELQILAMITVTFISLPYVGLVKGHILIDFVLEKFPNKVKPWIKTANDLIVVTILFVIVWCSFNFAMDNLDRSTEILHIPVAGMMFLITLGCLVAALTVLLDFFRDLNEARKTKWWPGITIVVILPFIIFGMAQYLAWIQASQLVAGLVVVVLMLLLTFLGMPLGYSLTVTAFCGITYLSSLGAAFGLIGSVPYFEVARVFMLVIPFFVLMGALCAATGIGGELMDTAKKWMGRIPGSLAMATIGAGAMLGAVIGDSISASAALVKVALPEMKKAGYSDTLSCAATAAAGTLGMMIPPSGIMMIYGIITQTSISKLFIAGIVPGIVVSGALMTMIVLWVRRSPNLAPRSASTTIMEKLIATKGTWGMLVVFLLSIGGLYAGLFTPVEAGAIGAFGAIVIAVARRKISRGNLNEALLSTAQTAGMLLFLFVGIGMLSAVLSLSEIPSGIANLVQTYNLSFWQVVSGLVIFYFLVGFIMPVFAVVVITIPILLPTLQLLGIDLVWFGIVMVMITMIGQITPPIGLALFAVKGVGGDMVPIQSLFKGVTLFWLVEIPILILVLFFPQIALFLPNLMQ